MNPLQSLNSFLNEKVKEAINTVHILPFSLFSSDDGFSVIDVKTMNPDLGDWNGIKKIANNFKLQADLVINHTSSKSEWFKNFLKNQDKAWGFFIEKNLETDLSKVT